MSGHASPYAAMQTAPRRRRNANESRPGFQTAFAITTDFMPRYNPVVDSKISLKQKARIRSVERRNQLRGARCHSRPASGPTPV